MTRPLNVLTTVPALVASILALACRVDPPTSIDPNPAVLARSPSAPAPDPRAQPAGLALTGIWHIVTGDPGVFAPNIPMTKSIGVVLWRIQWQSNKLVVFEHVPSYEVVTSPDPNDYPYEKLKLENVDVDAHARRVSFKVDRSVGAFEAYEYFDFDHIESDEISGEYTYYDPHSRVTGYGPKWVVTIRLGRYV